MSIYRIIPTTLLSLTIFLSISQLAFGSADSKEAAADGSEVTSKLSGVSVPQNISKEAQGTVEFFNSIIAETGEKLFSGFPESSDDLDAWQARFEKGVGDLKAMNDEAEEWFTGTITPLQINGIPTLDIRPKDWEDDNGKVLSVADTLEVKTKGDARDPEMKYRDFSSPFLLASTIKLPCCNRLTSILTKTTGLIPSKNLFNNLGY